MINNSNQVQEIKEQQDSVVQTEPNNKVKSKKLILSQIYHFHIVITQNNNNQTVMMMSLKQNMRNLLKYQEEAKKLYKNHQ